MVAVESFARFIAAKFSPLTHNKSIDPRVFRPAAFSARIRETASAVLVNFT